MVFVKAQVGPPNIGDPEEMFTVQYFDEKGNMTIRSGGKRAWRCNNPGNLRKSTYSIGKDRHSIGVAGTKKDVYAVYPDYETGHDALVVMLRGSKYSPLSLRTAMSRYDKTNSNYINQIVSITGFDPERIIKSLNDTEFKIFWKAIEHIEKWEVGREDFIEKYYISGVHKKHGIITEYLVQRGNSKIWFSKEESIKLTMENRLHATLVHMKNGSIFLRPEYHQNPFELII